MCQLFVGQPLIWSTGDKQTADILRCFALQGTTLKRHSEHFSVSTSSLPKETRRGQKLVEMPMPLSPTSELWTEEARQHRKKTLYYYYSSSLLLSRNCIFFLPFSLRLAKLDASLKECWHILHSTSRVQNSQGIPFPLTTKRKKDLQKWLLWNLFSVQN